jgi:hypothetical protein
MSTLETRELKREIEFYKGQRFVDAFARGNSVEIKTQRIFCFRPMEADSKYINLPSEVIKEYHQKEVAQQIAEEILKHKEFFSIEDLGFGYRYDLEIVKRG